MFLQAVSFRDGIAYHALREDLPYEWCGTFQPSLSQTDTKKVSLYVPSILQVFKTIEDQDYDAIVVSTPGPMGLLGLVCGSDASASEWNLSYGSARIALNVTGDPMFGWHLPLMFYKQVDRIFFAFPLVYR